MLIVLWGLNNIIAYMLLTTHRGVPFDSYHHQTSNNFEKLPPFKGTENTLMITAPILLVFHMHIGATRLIEDGAPNTEFDAEERLYPGSIGLDWDERGEIEKTIAIDKDNKNEEDPWEKNRQLKREK